MNESQRPAAQHGAYIANKTVLCISKFVKRTHVKCSYHKKNIPKERDTIKLGEELDLSIPLILATVLRMFAYV